MRLLNATILLTAAVSMSGCVPVAIAYGGSREQTKGVIVNKMAVKRSGVSPVDAANCVIAGMTYKEVFAFGNSKMASSPPNLDAKVDEVLQRPEVDACIGALPKTAAAK